MRSPHPPDLSRRHIAKPMKRFSEGFPGIHAKRRSAARRNRKQESSFSTSRGGVPLRTSYYI